MVITMKKYVIMTEDRKQIETVEVRKTKFVPVEDIYKTKKKIQLRSSFGTAKSGFSTSHYHYRWDEPLQMFVPKFKVSEEDKERYPNYIIVKTMVTYELHI